MKPGRALRGMNRLVPTRPRLRLPPRLARDQYLWYTATLAPIALLTALADGKFDDAWAVVAMAPVFVGAQALLGLVPSARRPLTDLGWSFLRLLVAFGFVALQVIYVGGPSRPLAALYIPVVVAAAAVGLTQGAVLGLLATAIYLAPILGGPSTAGAIAARAMALAGVGVLLAYATRRLMRQLEGAAATLRVAIVAERRRSRQIAGMEAVSRALVVGGQTDEVLRRALVVLSERFGYRYGSIYLWDGERLQLGAQQNYTSAPLAIEPGVGIVGRVARSHELAYVADVRNDPEYVAIHEHVVSEICAPLVIDGAFLGVLNIESVSPLDRTDRDLVATLADRARPDSLPSPNQVAAALAVERRDRDEVSRHHPIGPYHELLRQVVRLELEAYGARELVEVAKEDRTLRERLSVSPEGDDRRHAVGEGRNEVAIGSV